MYGLVEPWTKQGLFIIVFNREYWLVITGPKIIPQINIGDSVLKIRSNSPSQYEEEVLIKFKNLKLAFLNSF